MPDTSHEAEIATITAKIRQQYGNGPATNDRVADAIAEYWARQPATDVHRLPPDPHARIAK